MKIVLLLMLFLPYISMAMQPSETPVVGACPSCSYHPSYPQSMPSYYYQAPPYSSHPVNVYVSSAANNSNTNSSQSYLTSVINASAIAKATNYVHQLLDTARTQALPFIAHLKKLIYRHKYKIVAAVTGGIYVAICVRIIADQRYLSNRSLWNCWHDHQTFQELCQIPTGTLTHTLLIDIQNSYLSLDKPTNLISALMKFLHDIDNEERRITSYVKYTKIVSKLPFSWLFPIQSSSQAIAHARLTRLQFLRHIVISWIAEQNIGNYPV